MQMPLGAPAAGGAGPAQRAGAGRPRQPSRARRRAPIGAVARAGGGVGPSPPPPPPAAAATAAELAHASRTLEVAQLAAAPPTVTPPPPGAINTPGGAAKAALAGAQSLDERLAAARAAAKALKDRVYYGDLFPPLGSFQISYARLLELLSKRKVKRLILLGDGRTAVVEVPVENTESDFASLTYDRRDTSVQYADEVPEWKMEKNRYYCELPGDVWEEGTLMGLIKGAQERRVLGADGRLRVPYDSLLRLNEVRPELQVVDPGDAYVWLNQYAGQFLPIAGLLALRLAVGAGDWLLRRLAPAKKTAEQELAEALGAHRAKEYNVPADKKEKGGGRGGGGAGGGAGARRDTGVRYADVAGVDAIKRDVREVLDILLGDEAYRAVGALPLRGVLLEGPPGTGKTLLARAMAGEAGVPFFSANGAEFVEMFQGVAAARIRSLFRAARKAAPAIVFIDEIDAIGKARGSGPSDSGTAEREQGLLQLLAEMDGFARGDAVLVVGATNRATALDEALLRPGRFDRVIRMGRPSPANRLRILQVHARGKPVDRSNDDALLAQVAELTIGYSGAELANLLNEAAILAVRRDAPGIDLPVLKEAMDKIRLGLPHAPLPAGEAKRRFAAVEAARAVAFALTPGLPPVEHVTIRPRGAAQARILFVPQEPRKDGGTWHLLAQDGRRPPGYAPAPGARLTPFELAAALVTPLYAARAAEEELFGADAASLLTAREVARASELARWIVVDSTLHPASRGSPVRQNVPMGGGRDPTTAWQDAAPELDAAVLALQRAAADRAALLVRQRRPVIEAVTAELCAAPDETVLGSRIAELLEATPLVEVEGAQPDGSFVVGDGGGRAAAAAELGELLATPDAQALVRAVLGRVEDFDLLPPSVAAAKAAQVRAQLLGGDGGARLAAAAAHAAAAAGRPAGAPPPPFPPAPRVPEDRGVGLGGWMEPDSGVITL